MNSMIMQKEKEEDLGRTSANFYGYNSRILEKRTGLNGKGAYCT